MKIKYLMLCGALFLGTAALTSCSEDESYDVYGYDYTRAYFNVAKQTTNGMIVSTPVGLVTSLDAKVVVKTTSAATSDTKVALAIDNSVVDEYNKEHGTSYLPVPDGALELSSNVISMKAGKLVTEDTVDVKINEEVAKNMNSSDGYLAAVVITSADNGVRPSSNAAITYIHLGYSESCINDDATELVGKELEDKSNWKAIDCSEDFSPSTFSNLFAGGWSARWPLVGDEDHGQFTVDLGEELNLAGFYMGCYILKGGYDVEISKDNAAWTTLGNSADHTYVSKYDQTTWTSYNEYVLYAPMKARYVRFKMKFDTDSWYWTYAYYKAISSLNLYFD
jgi:hypothetical protein